MNFLQGLFMCYDRDNLNYLRDILRLYTGQYGIKAIANIYNISQKNCIKLYKFI